MDRTEADRILSRALFVMGADFLERRFVTSTACFRDLFVEALRLARPDCAFAADPSSEAQIVYGSEGLKASMTVDVMAGRLDARDMAASRELIVDYVIGIGEGIVGIMGRDDGKVLQEDIIAFVGTDEMFDDYRRLIPDDDRLITWPVCGRLHALAVVPFRGAVTFLTHRRLEAFDIDEEDVRDEVMQGLHNQLEKTRLHVVKAEQDALIVTGFGYTASLLLLPSFLEGLRAQLADDLVIHVEGDFLYVVAQSNLPALAKMMEDLDAGRVSSLFEGSQFYCDDDGLSPLDREAVGKMLAVDEDFFIEEPVPVRVAIN